MTASSPMGVLRHRCTPVVGRSSPRLVARARYLPADGCGRNRSGARWQPPVAIKGDEPDRR